MNATPTLRPSSDVYVLQADHMNTTPILRLSSDVRVLQADQMNATPTLRPSSDVRVLQAVLQGAVLVEAAVGLGVSVQGGLPPFRGVVVVGRRGQVGWRGGEVFTSIPAVLPFVLLQHHGQVVDVHALAVAFVEHFKVHLLLLLLLLLRRRLAVHCVVVQGVVVAAVNKQNTVKTLMTTSIVFQVSVVFVVNKQSTVKMTLALFIQKIILLSEGKTLSK